MKGGGGGGGGGFEGGCKRRDSFNPSRSGRSIERKGKELCSTRQTLVPTATHQRHK